MTYMFGELTVVISMLRLISISNYVAIFLTDTKQTNILDGSKVVPFHKVRKELFHPERPENQSTTKLVK